MRASFTMLNNTEEEKNWCGQEDGNDEHVRFKMPFGFIALDYKKTQNAYQSGLSRETETIGYTQDI